MSTGRPICLVLLAWNGWELTRRALDSLLATDLDGARVLVVDNGSTDATAAGLAAYRERLEVRPLDCNRGFVRGNNAGIAAADPHADIVLLNNDLEFTQRDWLCRLRATAHADPRHGIVGCRLAGLDGTLQHAGSRVLPDDGIGVQIESGRRERDIGQYAGRDRDVQGVVFAVAYLRREVIDAIGPLSTDYDTYFEDSDYCLRARRAGFVTRLCGGVTLRHVGGASTAERPGERERLLAAGRRIFLGHWRAALEAEYTAAVHWLSALDFPPRYAAISRPLLVALDRAGVRATFGALYRDVLPPALHEDGDAHHYVLNAIRARTPPLAPPITVACGEAALFRHARGGYRIGYGAFDTAVPDADWLAAARDLDEVWVPSPFHRTALREAGVAQPIEVMPWGVDADYFHPAIRHVPGPAGDRVFVCVAAWDGWDRPWYVIEAFQRAFRRHDPVRLLCAIDDAGVDLAAVTRALRRDVHGGRVEFLPLRRLARDERAVLLRSAAVWVGAGRASARHLGALEAMACGVPVVAPAQGALAEVLDEQTGFPLALPHEDACIEALVARLHETAADPVEATRRGAAAASRIATAYTWEHTAAAIRARLAALAIETRAPRLRTSAARPHGRVLVLGMHRSGTSCVAGLLQTLGLWGGRPDEFLANPAENPRGFFERGDVHAVCVEALAGRGGDWSIPLGWDEAAAAPARARFRTALASLLANLEAHGAWFLKEPRLCLLATEMLDLVPDAVLVHVRRAPGEVARSIAARHGLSLPHALALWEYYALCTLATLRGRTSFTVDYHALLEAPAATAAALYDGLRRHGVEGLRELQPAEAEAWAEPLLNRQRSAGPVPLGAEQAALWQAMCAGATEGFGPEMLSLASRRLLETLYAEHQQVRAREREHG